MIRWEQLEALFRLHTGKNSCVEILFSIKDHPRFSCCWMGKLWDPGAKKEAFWYGLTEDGKNAFDYRSFEEMIQAPVFEGKSLAECWPQVVIEEIDGCDPEERLRDLLKNAPLSAATR